MLPAAPRKPSVAVRIPFECAPWDVPGVVAAGPGLVHGSGGRKCLLGQHIEDVGEERCYRGRVGQATTCHSRLARLPVCGMHQHEPEAGVVRVERDNPRSAIGVIIGMGNDYPQTATHLPPTSVEHNRSQCTATAAVSETHPGDWVASRSVL